jgi:hypothetical protein
MLLHYPSAPAPDRRQSQAALAVARGTRRLLAGLGFASVTELTLASGRRADIVALAEDGSIWIIEVKSSVPDLRADTKWQDYRRHCDRLLFAIPDQLPPALVPFEAGLIIADPYGAELVREAPEHRLTGSTRKAMMLRFARATAMRLHALVDPDATGAIV